MIPKNKKTFSNSIKEQKKVCFFLLLCFSGFSLLHQTAEVRGVCRSQPRALVNGTDIKGKASPALEIWSFRLISFFFEWPCCTDLYASPLLFSSGDWMGLCSLKSLPPWWMCSTAIYVALTYPSPPPATVGYINLTSGQKCLSGKNVCIFDYVLHKTNYLHKN